MRNRLADWVNAGRVGLYRDTSNGWIAGVCAGIAERLTIKPLWVRIAFVVTATADRVAPTVIVYVILMLVLERRTGPVAAGMPMGSDFFADRYTAASVAMPFGGASASGAGIGEVSARFAALDARLNRIEAAVMSDDLSLRRKFRELGG